MIKELAFVAYSVRDVPRATAFYRDIIGLKPGELFNDEWVEFDIGNATFAIDGAGEGVGMPPGHSSGAAFEVDDVTAMRQRLLETGTDVTEVYDFRHVGCVLRKIPTATALRSTRENNSG